MPHRRLRNRSILRIAASTMILALCVGVSYGTGAIENIAFNVYQNTSPPLETTSGGLTLALAHSRYLTIEPITLIVTNHTGAPIYLPASVRGPNVYRPGPLPVSGDADPCQALVTWFLTAQGWQSPSLGTGCDGQPELRCPGGTEPAGPSPALFAVGPDETVGFEMYYGQPGSQLWPTGAYRFSVRYGLTPSEATMMARYPGDDTYGLTVTSAPVTLTRAWWSPPGYLRWPDWLVGCPMRE